MKIMVIIVAICSSFVPLFAQGNCVISQERPIQLMQKEMARWKLIFNKQNPPIYYMAYTYKEFREKYLEVNLGGIEQRIEEVFNLIDVDTRVGNKTLDNTRVLKKQDNASVPGKARQTIAIGNDATTFNISLWQATQASIEQAQRNFSFVKMEDMTTSKRGDNSDDFAFPPKENYCHTADFREFDLDAIAPLLVEASKLIKGKKFIRESNFYFTVKQGHRYFVDSEGTSIKTPLQEARLVYNFSYMKEDGQWISRGKIYDVSFPKDIPSKERLMRDVNQSIHELELLNHAEEADPVTVPVILKNKAMGVFVHEILGHRLEGHRQKNDSFGKTFTNKLGKQILPSFLSIIDDPTMKYFNNFPVRGYYEFDDEGVRAREVILVDKGVLKNFLMSSSPIEKFPTSNGHGRKAIGYKAVARMGNIVVKAEKTVSYAELEKLLIEEIIHQKKPYGIIIEDLEGGYTFTDSNMPQTFKLNVSLAYKVYPNGEKEVIRGADIVGTPLVSFSEIIASADDYAIFNGSCGAESGWVAQSEIAPSVLLKSLEIQKQEKSVEKLPILLPPSTFTNWEPKK